MLNKKYRISKQLSYSVQTAKLSLDFPFSLRESSSNFVYVETQQSVFFLSKPLFIIVHKCYNALFIVIDNNIIFNFILSCIACTEEIQVVQRLTLVFLSSLSRT